MPTIPSNPQSSGPGDPEAASQLLVIVYDELRQLAAARLALESGMSLQPTELVHEAYLRLMKANGPTQWENRGHFFAAAAESMRRILIDIARRKRGPKRGGSHARRELTPDMASAPDRADDLIALDEALSRFAVIEPRAAEIVKLRYFAGMTIPEIAEAMDIAPRTADRDWAYARAWLIEELKTIE